MLVLSNGISRGIVESCRPVSGKAGAKGGAGPNVHINVGTGVAPADVDDDISVEFGTAIKPGGIGEKGAGKTLRAGVSM